MRIIKGRLVFANTSPRDVEESMPRFLRKLDMFGPRFVRDLRQRERDSYVDLAERLGLIQRFRVKGGDIMVGLVADYEAWVRDGRKRPKRRRLASGSVVQMLVRGTLIEHLVEESGYRLVEHVNLNLTRLKDSAGKPVLLIVKHDGYTSKGLVRVLNEKCGEVQWGQGRVLIYDRRPGILAQTTQRVAGWYAEVHDLRPLIPANLLRSF